MSLLGVLLLILNLFLFALIAVLIIEVILYILGFFFTPLPDKLRKLLYAIVGVLLLIWLVSAFAGGAPQWTIIPIRR